MDFVAYRNHVYRVFYLSCRLGNAAGRDHFAIAAAFHDLGIWSANTWDYLAPSTLEAREWMSGQEFLLLGDERIVILAINAHHQVRTFRGEGAQWVEPFRRADWLDLSLGLRYGKGNRQYYRDLKNAWPYRGFHRRLAVFFFRNLVRHPLKPLPMFR